MKYAVIGDIHGQPLDNFIKEIREFDPVLERNPIPRVREKGFLPEIESADLDYIICTGDFDLAESVRQYRNLKNTLEEVEFIEVPGNHDEALLNYTPISSGTMRELGKGFEELYNELREEENEGDLDFLQQLMHNSGSELSNHSLETEIGGLNTLVVHAGLSGDLSSNSSCPREKRDLWYRLYGEKEYMENFERMSEKGVELMIRGHDHSPELGFYSDGALTVNQPEPGQSFELEEGSLYTLTHGAWYDGWYATLETGGETTELTYHQLDTAIF